MKDLKAIQNTLESTRNKFPLDIQLFAEDPQDPPADPPIDPPEPPVGGLTQKDIDDALVAARIKWDEEQNAQETEAQRLAKMTADQKKEYLDSKKADALTRREAELNKRELMSTAKETLTEKGLPIALAVSLDYKDADTCNASIETIGKAFNDAVQKAVEDRIKGGNPMRRSTTDSGNTFTKEEVAKMSPAEINKNWDAIQDMMKQGLLN